MINSEKVWRHKKFPFLNRPCHTNVVSLKKIFGKAKKAYGIGFLPMGII